MSRNNKSGKQRGTKVKEYVGVGQMTRDGSLFVTVEELEDDIYVRPAKTRGALSGDTVRIMAKAGRSRQGAHAEGEVLAVLERSKKPFVGVLHRMGSKAWVLMQSKNMPYDIEVAADALPQEAQSGYKVAAVVDDWPPLCSKRGRDCSQPKGRL